MLFETKIDLDEKEQEFIDFVLGNNFPWFFEKTTSEKYMMFGHALMARNKNNLPETGEVNSTFFDNFQFLFNKVCEKNKIKVNTILRMAINNTYHSCEKMGEIHTDHDFPHYNFLWYLNDFTEGSTFIFDEKKEIEIKAEKNKVVIFDGKPHAQGFCLPHENRVCFVTTFI